MLQAGPNVCLYSPSLRDGHGPDDAGRRAPRPSPSRPTCPFANGREWEDGREAGERVRAGRRPPQSVCEAANFPPSKSLNPSMSSC